jgi:hypothetical protein
MHHQIIIQLYKTFIVSLPIYPGNIPIMLVFNFYFYLKFLKSYCQDCQNNHCQVIPSHIHFA